MPITSLWCFSCAGAGYTRRCESTSVHLCTSSLQNLAVSPDFYSLSVSLWNDLSDPLFDSVGLAGFKSRADAFLLAYLLAHFLAPAVLPFSSFILWVGVVRFGSSD